ncbi:response regulator transcription factor [Candidatus Uhrbacteria bacterium]|nr:response regulator transcription factor [Candidatus Uhrbacteria bacterium]
MARILIIDDEELVRFTLREILVAAGHEVIEASNGNEGVGLQRARPCDIVITDIIMPEKEGLETIVELKGEYPDLKIIAISGGGRTRSLDFLKMAGEFGADHVVIKPFADDDLMKCINACSKNA